MFIVCCGKNNKISKGSYIYSISLRFARPSFERGTVFVALVYV